MEKITVELFANIVNNVVLRTPGRKFPGVVIQGDSLSILYNLAEEVCRLAQDTQSKELQAAACELADLLAARLKVYEEVLAEHNIKLPYFRSEEIGKYSSKYFDD
jgi:hypothetical protein